ncbi:MAG: FAD-dependent oxidoreductase [Chloroflexi bacterium]|nr:MAG: FAD-dependent oxidoreductase [Chloroflexota bacterium]
METARAVVIGGGITGTSVAYHLAKAGWRDVVLLEKDELTSGSTCHAAGLVTQFNPSPTMMRFRTYSIEVYQELGVFETVGSLRFASTRDQLMELQRGVSRARGIGLDVELVSAEDAARLMPVISSDSLYGAVWLPGDGHLDPHSATHALAAAARNLGARVLTHRRVTGIELSARGAITAVQTEAGRIETEVVVVAGGIWGPQIAAMAGAFVVSTPVDHQHAALLAVPGHELPHDMPCFRDPDNLVYGKAEAGGMVLGGYELNPVARWIDGVPWDHAEISLPPDQARFEPLLAGAARRFPFVHEAGIVKLVSHPDAMTPDAGPLVGAVPGARGLYMAAGLSLNGFGGAGGIGRSIAEIVTGGETELDLYAYRPWRFGPAHRAPQYAAELARETYKYYYYQRYPLDNDEWARPRRTSALHTRMQDLGAVFGVNPPYFDLLAAEHLAFRERVGIIDMSSFGKIEITGPGALPLLERVAGNLIDRPAGSVVYTQLLEKDGGIAADVTITRVSADHFRLVTGAGYVNSDLGWLQMQVREGDPPAHLRESSEDLSVIGMWGPKARQVLERVTRDDVTEQGFAFMRAREIHVEGIAVFAQRVTYVGELGWELYVEPVWAGQIWDRLMAAGHEYGITPGGYRVLDSLRMEKGYRYYAADMGLLDNPFEAGLGFCVHREKWPAIPRDVTRRLRTLAVGGDDYVPIYGGEAVISDGHVVGRLRSCAYGFTVKRNLAYSYLPIELKPGAQVDVEVFGRLLRAAVMPDAVLSRQEARQHAS